MQETKSRTRTKLQKEIKESVEDAEQVLKQVEDVPELPLTNAPQPHILSISDETGLPLLFIGKNFENLGLESKISVIQHLKSFISKQKSGIIKLVEDL